MPIHVNWSRLDLGGLSPSGSAEALAAIRQFTTLLDAELAKVVAWIAASSASYLNRINALEALVGELLDLLRALTEVFTATSVSYTYWAPESIRKSQSPRQVLAKIAASYLDRTDAQRPIAIAPETAFCTYVMFATGPNPRDVLLQMDALRRLLGIPMVATRPRVRSMFDENGGTYPPKAVPGQGLAPNWTTKRLADMGELGTFVQSLLDLERMVQVQRSELELLRRMVELSNARTSQILAILERAERALQVMAEVAVTTTGLQTVQISGFGSTPEQVAGVLSAARVPEYPFSDREFTAAMVMHVQAGSGTQIAAFLNLFGLSLADGAQLPVDTRRPTVRPRPPVRAEDTVRNPWGLS
jgi:hypothetical protein